MDSGTQGGGGTQGKYGNFAKLSRQTGNLTRKLEFAGRVPNRRELHREGSPESAL